MKTGILFQIDRFWIVVGTINSKKILTAITLSRRKGWFSERYKPPDMCDTILVVCQIFQNKDDIIDLLF